MSPRGWPPSQQQQPGQQQQHWQGGEAQRSNPASPKPAWPPYQAQQQPAPMQWQGQAQSSEQGALPSPRPSWQPTAPVPQPAQQQTQQHPPHANTAAFDPSPRASHAQQPWPPQQSTFQPAPMQSQQPSWGAQEQQYAAQENGSWPTEADQSQVSAATMGNTWESEQMQAANPMDNGNQGQMNWQQNEQWDTQPQQVSNPINLISRPLARCLDLYVWQKETAPLFCVGDDMLCRCREWSSMGRQIMTPCMPMDIQMLALTRTPLCT